ncbi:hypothetical protein WJX73_006863 [Symbiochloris irregularis]|uniref:FAD-binding domain-containing protein n=1 Tax=Symbiochloris irregularis TaxID=706552 RepID=A0AAW1NUH0_9CHLO
MDGPALRQATDGARGRAAVVGGGPAGLAAAISLANRNFSVLILEKQASPTPEAQVRPRSYVYGINTRGQWALDQMGLRRPGQEGEEAAEINGLRIGFSKFGRARKGGPSKIKRAKALSTVWAERACIVDYLSNEARRQHHDRITTQWGCSLLDLNTLSSTVTYSTAAGDTRRDSFDLIVGADGANSAVRAAMHRQDPQLQVTHLPARRRYKPFYGLKAEGDWVPAPPQGTVVSFITAPTHLMILWKGPADTVSGLIGASEHFMLQPRTKQDWLQLLETYHPELPSHWMTSAAEQLQEAKAARAASSVKCSYIVQSRTVLIGDAAHACTPNMGQGVNTAMEDAVQLAEAIQACRYDVPAGLQRFQDERLPEMHAMHQLDLNVDARYGMQGKLHPEFLVSMATFVFWGTLTKIFPQVQLPPTMASNRASVSFQKVVASIRAHKAAVGAILGSALILLARWVVLLSLQGTVRLPGLSPA